MEPILAVGLILFLAWLVQGVIGFGSALVAMPLLAATIGIRVAAPLFAVIALMMMAVMLLLHRRAINISVVWRLAAASWIAIPVGVYTLKRLPDRLTLTLLGIIIVGYVLYVGLRLPVPALRSPRWSFLFGLLGGLLSGAYNSSGPPIVIFGHIKGWEPAEFKSNLQGYFFLNSVLTATSHYVSGSMRALAWQHLLVGAASGLLGLLLGIFVERYISADHFRPIVLILLFIIGLRLILTQL